MKLPKFIHVCKTSFMELTRTGYTTRGWDLPIENIEERNNKFYIKNFMSHLDGEELKEITSKEYHNEIIN